MRLDVLPRDPVDVLIADDDPQLRGSVRMLLEAQGFTCAEAADGPQTVAVARKLAPRCVLLDLAMPGLDGLTVARRLRMHPRTAHAHVHCLTGRADPESRRQAEDAGCELFLTKPIDPTAVVAAVRGWTGLTRAAAEELLDWLEAHGYVPAAVTYEEGVGFAVRLPRPFGSAAQLTSAASASDRLGGGDRADIAPSLPKPVPGQRARYAGVYRADGAGGHIAVRVDRMLTLLACIIAALGLLLGGWLGILTFLQIGVCTILLAIVLAIPAEERWLPSFAPECVPEVDGRLIEFEGIVSERGRFGPWGSLHRRVQVLRVVRQEPPGSAR
jgi:CheY-like chemotaxis protein